MPAHDIGEIRQRWGRSKPTTDALIELAKFDYPDLDAELVDRVVPECIDALYATRDAGLSMHHAGAVVAVAALRIVHDLRRLET